MSALIELLAIIVALPFAILMAIPSMLLRSWALVTLWGWFVVPLFHVSPIGYSVALGLFLVVGLFHSDREYKDHHLDYKITIISALTGPLLSVATGWVVRRWM